MVLVYHVILEDHVIIGSFDFMVCSPERYVTSLPSLVIIGNVIVEI